MKKLSSGCCGAGGDEEKPVKVKDKNKNNYSFSVKLKISGMTCKNCQVRVENAFNRMEGVWAKADFAKGSAEILSKAYLSDEEIKNALSNTLYDIKEIER